MDRYSPLGLAFVVGIVATLFVSRIVRRTFRKKPKPRKEIEDLVGYDIDVDADTVHGPAWNWFRGYAAEACNGELRTGTCVLCQRGNSLLLPDTTYYGPYGPGTAQVANVKIGDQMRTDYIVTTEHCIPQNWKKFCAVNWDRMVLTGEHCDSERCIYAAVLEMTRDQARTIGLLPRELPPVTE